LDGWFLDAWLFVGWWFVGSLGGFLLVGGLIDALLLIDWLVTCQESIERRLP
jgi:hypothetical protein